MLIVQTSLVAAGRVDVHRRLGLLGFGMACLVVVLGLLVATDWQVRHFAPGEAGMRARAFYTVTISTMLAFSTLIYFAFRNRFNPAAHKRLILIATITLRDAAFVLRSRFANIFQSTAGKLGIGTTTPSAQLDAAAQTQ